VDADYYIDLWNVAENVLPELPAIRTVIFARPDRDFDRETDTIAERERRGITLRKRPAGYAGEHLVTFRNCSQQWAFPCPKLRDMYYHISYSNPLEPPEYETSYDHLHAGYGTWED
jgi:hypothetical protein